MELDPLNVLFGVAIVEASLLWLLKEAKEIPFILCFVLQRSSTYTNTTHDARPTRIRRKKYINKVFILSFMINCFSMIKDNILNNSTHKKKQIPPTHTHSFCVSV